MLKKKLSIRLDRDLLDRATAKAKREKMSLTALITKALLHEVAMKRVLPLLALCLLIACAPMVSPQEQAYFDSLTPEQQFQYNQQRRQLGTLLLMQGMNRQFSAPAPVPYPVPPSRAPITCSGTTAGTQTNTYCW
jgi:hypothetical protein